MSKGRINAKKNPKNLSFFNASKYRNGSWKDWINIETDDKKNINLCRKNKKQNG
jgi:hypothetical protein